MKYFERNNVPDFRPYLIFSLFFLMYLGLAWVVSGGETWWVIDFVDGQNIFFGDDAYRFFLSRSAWINPDLYTYSFVLPGQLFLDGTIINLVSGDLFLSRCAHAVVGAAGVALVYLCGRQLGLSRSVVFAAVLIMGFLPRYSLMSLSFYGEVWLSFFLVLALFLFLRKNFVWMAFIASWLPLLRPEGIFFLIPLGVYLARERRVREITLLVLPGFLYFVFLWLSLPSLADYSYWRQELRTILSKLDYLVGEWALFSLYSFLFTVPAVLALFLPAARRMWPFLLGAVLWVAWFQLLLINELATFENRYSYVLIPLITLLWAIFFCGLMDHVSKYMARRWAFSAHYLLVFGLAFAIISIHLVKTNNVRQAVRQHGYSGWIERITQGRWDELYGYYPKETLDARKEMVKLIETALDYDKGIDNLSIYTNSLFYHLDPEKIPKRVRVGFLTNGYMVFHLLLDGQTFIQHPGGRMYSYMDYGEPDFRKGERRALVVTIMPLENYPYTWKRDAIEMYLFSYFEFERARVDISTRPKLTPQAVQDAYSSWYGK